MDNNDEHEKFMQWTQVLRSVWKRAPASSLNTSSRVQSKRTATDCMQIISILQSLGTVACYSLKEYPMRRWQRSTSLSELAVRLCPRRHKDMAIHEQLYERQGQAREALVNVTWKWNSRHERCMIYINRGVMSERQRTESYMWVGELRPFLFPKKVSWGADTLTRIIQAEKDHPTDWIAQSPYFGVSSFSISHTPITGPSQRYESCFYIRCWVYGLLSDGKCHEILSEDRERRKLLWS